MHHLDHRMFFNPCEDAEIQRRIFPARSIKQFQAGDLVQEIESPCRDLIPGAGRG